LILTQNFLDKAGGGGGGGTMLMSSRSTRSH
jgi:hypothetical protein